MNPKNFADLRNILAELITDEQSIRRIVDDAGIDRRNIDFRSNAKNIWHSVLTEAENLHRVEGLLDVVADEYGDNQKFQAASKAYRESINKTGATPVGLHAAVNRQPRPVNPWRQRLSALFLGLLVIGFGGGAWYWGILGPRANDGSIATATPILADSLAGATVAATLAPTEVTLPITPSVVTTIATNLSVTNTATVTVEPTITDVQTAPSVAVQTTAVFTATATAIVTEIPAAAFTSTLSLVTDTHLTQSMPKYPCEATTSTNANQTMIALLSAPAGGTMTTTIPKNVLVQILRKDNRGNYEISYKEDLKGWIRSDNLELSDQCPR